MRSCDTLFDAANTYVAPGVAAGSDLIYADHQLELAVHAPTAFDCAAALTECARWMRMAQANYGTVPNVWAERVDCGATRIEQYAASVPSSGPDLVAFQQGTLFPFHGVMGALMLDSEIQGPAYDEGVEMLGLGVLFFTLLGSVYWYEHEQRVGAWDRTRPSRRPGMRSVR